MSKPHAHIFETQHAFLVAWGPFAQEIGLVGAIEKVPLRQKVYRHRPQTKVLEFLVAQLSGLRQLQEISLAAHPLEKDQAVAAAWGQPAWADYTGLSRSLSGLSWEEVHTLVAALEDVSRPFIAQEVQELRGRGQRLRLDGDLTGIPVSNQSTSYPNADFGHMDAEIRLGYQAGVVSLASPSYGRLWLSVAHHPGDTVSSTQAENLVLAAEARLGLRPLRRTERLRERIQRLLAEGQPAQARLAIQLAAVQTAEQRLADARTELLERQGAVHEAEQFYQANGRRERRTSRLALARQRLSAGQRRLERRAEQVGLAEHRLQQTRVRLAVHQNELAVLQQRLARFDLENAENPAPPEMEFRLDAGFGSYENVALLVEMGYEVYTKPHSHQVVVYFQRKNSSETVWTRVGANAEMTAWQDYQLKHCAYPLDIGLERFYQGQKVRHSALFHFGRDPVTDDLPAWFEHYNGRQTIEAGIKEAKQVFYLHRLKVRSEPAIFLQEALVLFAANFIRWASAWIAARAQPCHNALDIQKLGVKRQVQVGAHVSARVVRDSEGILLMFSPHSVFAGKVLALKTTGLSGKDTSLPSQPKIFEVLGRFLRFGP